MKDDANGAPIAAAKSNQVRPNLGWMMRIVIHDEDAVHFSLDLETPPHAFE